MTSERRALLRRLYRGMFRIGVRELRAALGALARVGLVAKVEEGPRWLDPADPLLAELRAAEAAYHAVRDAHLAAEEAEL